MKAFKMTQQSVARKKDSRPAEYTFRIIRKEARKQGRKNGRKEGRKEGRMEGRKEGRKEGSRATADETFILHSIKKERSSCPRQYRDILSRHAGVERERQKNMPFSPALYPADTHKTLFSVCISSSSRSQLNLARSALP
jgi:hypothetical protein